MDTPIILVDKVQSLGNYSCEIQFFFQLSGTSVGIFIEKPYSVTYVLQLSIITGVKVVMHCVTFYNLLVHGQKHFFSEKSA